MRILCVGDVVGSVGRAMVAKHVKQIKEDYKVDFVVCNGENAAHGKGISRKIYYQLLNYGIDALTMGNHTFSKRDLCDYIDECDKMVRPGNLEPDEYGEWYRFFNVNGKKIMVVNLMGEVFMNQVIDSPFFMMEELLERENADIIIVDLHAEATSEKIAFTYQFADRCQIIFGTHTHVQTADERIVNKHCAAISDIGMCGPYHSVIGRDIEEILTRFLTGENTRFKIAEGDGIFSAILVDIDDQTNHATKVERIQIRPEGE